VSCHLFNDGILSFLKDLPQKGGGLPHHACAGYLIRGAGHQQRGQMMGEASVREPLGLLMAYHDHRVVGMPSHPAVEWQRGLLLGWKVVHGLYNLTVALA
jgi:hypothetical protein